MAALFASGQIVWLLLGFMVLEAGALTLYRWRTGNGIAAGALVINLMSGGSLLLALHAALTGQDWRLVGLWLGVSLVAHLADLRQRWVGNYRATTGNVTATAQPIATALPIAATNGLPVRR
jgi:hypothetical protein